MEKENLPSPVTNKSVAIKAMKNTTTDKFASKQPHEIFEEYSNAELKEMKLTEANTFEAQKNLTSLLSVAVLNTFHAISMMTGYHLLLRTRLYWEKEDEVGLLLLVYNAMSRKKFRGHQAICSFSRQ